MARTTEPPLVDHSGLVRPDPQADPLLVGSPAWFAWLAQASSFAFVGEAGSFTAHKERRSPAREYWKAYRHRAGQLHRAYLGKSDELTLERLRAVAAELAGAPLGAAPPPPDPPGARPGPPPEPQRPAASQPSLRLLSTKLALPLTSPHLVPRPRLAACLDTAIAQGRRLTLISAPAGFGKTTLLVEWLGARDRAARVAWLSLDDTDNHLGQFLAYLIAALETVRPGVGAEAWELLRAQTAQPPTRAILTDLVNALAAPAEPLVLILDDYHTITLPLIHEALGLLLDWMPAHLHIIMTSRADPPLPLARLRVRGQLSELRAAQLRFTGPEAAELLDRAHQLRLPAEALAALETRTEGWAAGLQLAALSLQQQDAAQISAFLADFTGSHTYVFDYLANEVFQQQPEPLRAFLVQTALLPRLCAPLCAAVTGRHDVQALLEQLERANLFLISLDSSRRWYRYHQLFRDFLRERLEREVGPEGRAALHRRASAWFEQAGLAGEAIEQALCAAAWQDARRCIAPLMAEERIYEHFLDWPRWAAALPDAALQADPDMCLRFAWILMFVGQGAAAERPLDLAEAAYTAADNRAKLGEVLGWRAVGCYWRRDARHAIAFARQALASLPAKTAEPRAIFTLVLGLSEIELGRVGVALDMLEAARAAFEQIQETFFALATVQGLLWACLLQGRLQQAERLYQEVLRRGGDLLHRTGPAPYREAGRLYYEWDDLAAAERVLREGLALTRRTGRTRHYPALYGVLARVVWARGDAALAAALLEQALTAAQHLGSPRDIAEAEVGQVWLRLAQGDLAAGLRWLAARAPDPDAEADYEQQPALLLLARIRFAQEQQTPGAGDSDALVRLLQRLLRAAEADQRVADQIAILLLLARAHAAARRPDPALAALAAALALGEPEGFVRSFVDEGEPLRALLGLQRARLPEGEAAARTRAYIDRLLAADAPAGAPAPEPRAPALLSEREHAILRLLADGCSVQEIAAHLIISVHTARSHVKHIYAKLEAHNRVEALKQARAHGLL